MGKTLHSLAVTGTMLRTLVRVPRTGTMRLRTRTTTFRCAASVRILMILLCSNKSRLIRQAFVDMVSLYCPASANTFGGSEKWRVAICESYVRHYG
jgi:hypothetical protein